MQNYTVDILGTTYKVLFGTEEEYPKLNKCDGYFDCTAKEIVVIKEVDSGDQTVADTDKYLKIVLRHELIHAFLYESGLNINSLGCSAWATNEEMVDWIALQFPKMLAVFNVLGATD